MKTFKILTSVLLLATVVFFSSCKKDDDDTATPSNGGGTMQLKYDGNDWSATLSVVGTFSNGSVNITGTDASQHQAGVMVYNVNGTGTYKIGSGSQNMGKWTQGLGQGDTYIANGALGSGEVNFTELTDKKAVGTFSFTGYSAAKGKISITEGKFSVTF